MVNCWHEEDIEYQTHLKKIIEFLRNSKQSIQNKFNDNNFYKNMNSIIGPMCAAAYSDFDGLFGIDCLFIRESNKHYYFNVIVESYDELEHIDDDYVTHTKFVTYTKEVIIAKDLNEFYFIQNGQVEKWNCDKSGKHHEKFEVDDLIPSNENDEEMINNFIEKLNKHSKLSNMTKEDKALSVFEFWYLLNKLKDTIRTGWMRSNVSKKRLESVAEHVYSTNNLAIAMSSQFGYDVDLYRVVFMIAIHELGETVIGDIPIPEQKENKSQLEREAVVEILDPMISKDMILSLYDEFEERKTKDAKFAFLCDKADCDLQCSVYQKYVSDENWSTKWINHDIKKYPYDKNFKAVLRLALDKKEERDDF